VRIIQTARQLTVDGVVGAQTWGALVIEVSEGSSGDAVRGVQQEFQFRNLSGDPDLGLRAGSGCDGAEKSAAGGSRDAAGAERVSRGRRRSDRAAVVCRWAGSDPAAVASAAGRAGGHALRVCGKGGKEVLVPLPPAADRAIAGPMRGPILLNSHGSRLAPAGRTVLAIAVRGRDRARGPVLAGQPARP
jgi:hypothetical protein